jgi:hypothetical protein
MVFDEGKGLSDESQQYDPTPIINELRRHVDRWRSLPNNVQTAVDTKHHLIVTHEVTNLGHDRTQLSNMSRQAKEAIRTDTLDVVADRGYFKGARDSGVPQGGYYGVSTEAANIKEHNERTF